MLVSTIDHITCSPNKRGRGKPKLTLGEHIDRDLLVNNTQEFVINKAQ